MQYQQEIKQSNSTLRIEIEVEPDHFYEQLFQNMEARPGEPLHTALLEAQQSHYRLYDQSIPLGQAPASRTHARPSPLNNSNASTSNPVDWNETTLSWHNYAEALQLAKQTGKSILFILYADWCPTCHAYRDIFYDQRIIDAIGNTILARANVDKQPELNTIFDLDGEYVPRTYLLNKNGNTIESIYEGKDFPRYFLSANTVTEFLSLLNKQPFIQ